MPCAFIQQVILIAPQASPAQRIPLCASLIPQHTFPIIPQSIPNMAFLAHTLTTILIFITTHDLGFSYALAFV
jgi:hypothetical protein